MDKKHNSTKSKSQLAAFRKAAEELECDDNEKAFDQKLGKIARQKPADSASSDD